jgi:hypothetical protein
LIIADVSSGIFFGVFSSFSADLIDQVAAVFGTSSGLQFREQIGF